MNDVVASCYANVPSHEAAHFFMSILRWYDNFARWMSIDKPFGDSNADGMHEVPRIMYKLAQVLFPSMFQSICE